VGEYRRLAAPVLQAGARLGLRGMLCRVVPAVPSDQPHCLGSRQAAAVTQLAHSLAADGCFAGVHWVGRSRHCLVAVSATWAAEVHLGGLGEKGWGGWDGGRWGPLTCCARVPCTREHVKYGC
jgi:hypothetical protein